MPTEKTAVVRVRVTPEMERLLARAADRAAMTLSDWMRCVLARAASEGAYAPRDRDARRARSED